MTVKHTFCSCCRFLGCTSMTWISSSPPLPHFLWSFVTWCVTMQLTDMMFKVCQENISHTQTIDIRQVACCLLFYHLNVTEEIETHQTRLRVYSLPLSNFLIWSVFWVVCFLFLANRSDTQCGLLQGLNMLCTQRWSSTFLGCIEWLFDLLLSQWPYWSSLLHCSLISGTQKTVTLLFFLSIFCQT